MKEKGPAGGIGRNGRWEDDSNMTSPPPGCEARATSSRATSSRASAS